MPARPIADSLFFKLVRLVNLTARPFVETLSLAHRLSLNEWRVMVVLAAHPGVAATDVVEATGLDKMSVSRALASLVRAGRVGKSADPADARRTRLALSARGQALFERIAAVGAERETQLFSGISGLEQAQMSQIADRMIASLREAPLGPEGGANADARTASKPKQGRAHSARA